MALKQRRVAVPYPRFSAGFIPRLLWGAGIVVAVLAVLLIGAGFFLTYRIGAATNNIENVSPTSFLLPSFEPLGFRDTKGAEHDGWLLLGLRGAPAIVMCPGYNSNRSDLLYLGVVLQANHYNVYLFNFSGAGSKAEFSNLGVSEAAIVQSAINKVMTQPGVNHHRVGLYGSTLGGYAAIVAAEKDPRVRALAADSVYRTPGEMFDTQMDALLGGTGSLFRSISSAEFRLLTLGTRVPQVQAGLSGLTRCAKLFIVAEDAPRLGAYTTDLYKAAPEPKRLLFVGHTETNLASDSERKEYENQALNFFLQSLSLGSD